MIRLPMKRVPYSSHALIQTLDRLRDTLLLLAVCISQKVCFLQYFIRLHVPHTDSLLTPVYILASNDWVLAGSRRDGDFDLWVLLREDREVVF